MLVMAGGYAKRMWPLTENRAKALLPVDGKPVIEHIIERIEPISSIQDVFVSTNKKFENEFVQWMTTFHTTKHVSLIVEPREREENKLGAIGGMRYCIEMQHIDEDLLVVAGDNLFDFELDSFINQGQSRDDSVIALYDISDVEKVRNRFGVVVLDENGMITKFEEKPAEPSSTLISTGIYFLKRKDLPKIAQYLEEKNNPDAFGYFFQWLKDRRRVRGFIFSGRWFDIGSIEHYAEAKAAFARVNDKTA